MVAGLARGVIECGLVAGGPPDQPDREEDRDLQDHGEEHDRKHPIHPRSV
jgi:hypothetical protein